MVSIILCPVVVVNIDVTESVHTLEPEVVETESTKEAESTSCKVLPGEGSEVRK